MEINKLLHVLWWIISDTVFTETSRNQEFMNMTGHRGAWIEIPKMFDRYKEEDTVKRNRRNYFLEYGRYP